MSSNRDRVHDNFGVGNSSSSRAPSAPHTSTYDFSSSHAISIASRSRSLSGVFFTSISPLGIIMSYRATGGSAQVGDESRCLFLGFVPKSLPPLRPQNPLVALKLKVPLAAIASYLLTAGAIPDVLRVTPEPLR